MQLGLIGWVVVCTCPQLFRPSEFLAVLLGRITGLPKLDPYRCVTPP